MSVSPVILRYKCKAAPVLKHYAMKTLGSGGIAPRLGRFTPGERAPVTPLTGGWMGPWTGPDAVDKRKISCPCLESYPGRPVRSPSLYRAAV
jgi:hypothetical protein